MKYYPCRYLFRRYEVLKKAGSGEQFLEIGPGRLDLSEALLDHYQTGVGIDFSDDSKRYLPDITADKQSRYNLKIEDFLQHKPSEKYDLIVACEVLEHVKDDVGFVAKIYSSLGQSGRVIITVPAKMRLWTLHDEVVGHIRRYERDELIKLLSTNDFKDIRLISYGFPFINITHKLRALYAKIQHRSKKILDQEQKTKDSGTESLPNILKYVSLIVNPTVFGFLSKISEKFNDKDLTDGYLVTASK